jgi:hypothetical protein
LARLVYFCIIITLGTATVFADEKIINSGVLTFGNGYKIWHDVLFAIFIFALPPILYEIFCRHWHVQA